LVVDIGSAIGENPHRDKGDLGCRARQACRHCRKILRVRDVHRLGAGTKERSYYPALAELLNALGQELKPKVLCLSDLGNTGAGHPDFGLFDANQVQKGEPRPGQAPERGVIEVKSAGDNAWFTAGTAQVSKYFGAYRLVIVASILLIGPALAANYAAAKANAVEWKER
jgi:hypothetical protein